MTPISLLFLDPGWKEKLDHECRGYWGWPWEQGGIWDVLFHRMLTQPPGILLQGTCVLKNTGTGALNSITGENWKKGTFVAHHHQNSTKQWLQSMIANNVVSSYKVRRECGKKISNDVIK